MKKFNLAFCSLVLFCLTTITFTFAARAAEPPRTGQSTCYDLDGNIIDHQGSGQDGDLQAGVVWPEPRFTDNGDGTITDNLTGLVWLKDGKCLEAMTWRAAAEMADKKTVPGRFQCVGISEPGSGWFLPEVRELETLINAEEVHGDRWLNGRGFRDIQPGLYWSATFGPDTYNAWAVNFANGEVVKSPMVDYLNVLLVHRPPASSPPEVRGPVIPESATRFVGNNDGTVTDKQTGLMWLRDGGCLGAGDWRQGLEKVKLLNQGLVGCRELTASYSDWSLPNRHELRSLVDHRTDLPALAENPFIGLVPRYWTSTTVSVGPSQAFALHFGAGELRRVDKKSINFAWAVRPVAGRGLRPRVPDKTEAPVVKLENFQLRPVGGPHELSWPPQRFTDLDDGTLIDNLTGLMWLKDGECLAKRQWYYVDFYLEQLNSQNKKIVCNEYSASYDDWELPDIETLTTVIAAANGEPAAWLNGQGVVDVMPRDYWTATDNKLNLYYAWAVNLRQGTPRNYPKDFPLYIWPFRRPQAGLPDKPDLRLMGNGENERLALAPGEELRISVSVDKVAGPFAAVYYFWYDSPDGSSWWLGPQGKWLDRETVLYEGNIFEVREAGLFLADTTELAGGVYNFHFVIKSRLEQTSPESLSRSDLQVILGDDVEIVEEDIVY